MAGTKTASLSTPTLGKRLARDFPDRAAVGFRRLRDEWGAAPTVTNDPRHEAILETLIGLYETGELRCAEGRLRIAPLLDTSEVRLRGPSAWDYSVRFPEGRLMELIDQSRVPVSDELVRVLLCLVYHHHDRYAWATKERAERRRKGRDEARDAPPG
jgi:hypothetical protein